MADASPTAIPNVGLTGCVAEPRNPVLSKPAPKPEEEEGTAEPFKGIAV